MGKTWPALEIHVPGCDPLLVDLVLAEIDEFQPTAIQEADESLPLRAFFASCESRDAAARVLASSFGSHLFVHPVEVEDEDWAMRSQAHFGAVTVGRIVVAPPWAHKTEQGSRSLFSIVIQPSMGFGTGHHATTRLMLRALQELPLAGRTVLDIGCGSGVLAIAAVRLGAANSVGLDVDPDALDNARENSELNDVARHVRFEEADFRESSSHAEVVLANLTGALLERAAPTLAAIVERGGLLIVSGFMETERAGVLPALQRHLALVRADQEDEWMCAVFSRAS